MADDVLPDSRCREVRGVVRHVKHGNLIPIYCANCGKPWGLVPEHHVTFAFALCDDCEELGGIAGLYKEPDSVFWERVQNAMAEEKVTTAQEIEVKLEDPSSVFSKLALEWEKHVRRF